jgi:hypothetical protein
MSSCRSASVLFPDLGHEKKCRFCKDSAAWAFRAGFLRIWRFACAECIASDDWGFGDLISLGDYYALRAEEDLKEL